MPALAKSAEGRETTSGHRLRSVDALRGIACLMVAMNHTLGIPGGGAAGQIADLEQLLLDAGLALFFVLSGYLIGGPYIRALVDGTPAPAAAGYALRRVMRIMPAYWAAILVTFLTLGQSSPLMQANGLTDTSLSGTDWLTGLLAVQTWVHGHAFTALPVIWTIPVEIAFYLLAPFMYIGARRLAHGRRIDARTAAVGLGAVWAAAIAIQWVYFHVHPMGGLGLAFGIATFHLAFLSSFCPGILLALLRSRSGRARLARIHEVAAHPQVRGAWPVAVVALFLFGFTMWHFGGRGTMPMAEWRRPLNALAGALVTWVALDATARWWRVAVRVLAPIGTISYGLFLFHWFVLRELFDHGLFPVPGVPSWAALPAKVALCLVFAIPLGALSWYLIERPCLLWSARRAREMDERRARVTGPVLQEAG